MRPETKQKIERLAGERSRLIDGLRDSPHQAGLAWCNQHSLLCDRVIQSLYEALREESPGFPELAVIATGGYGRREVAPHSDVDLTVVPRDDSDPALDTAVRNLFQAMHWAFGTVLRINLGYAYRLIADAPGLDAKTRTGLIDSRLVAGSPGVHQDLVDAFWESLQVGPFLLDKLVERSNAFQRHHDSPLVVEPNLKEGAGGLRCFHCANWLRSAIGERPSRPTAAYDTVLRMRNLLHLVTEKGQDVLTRPRQAEIADLLGQDMYEMMSHCSAACADLHAEYLRSLESLHEARFALSEGIVALRGEARLAGRPDAGDAAVGIAVATQLGLRVETLPSSPASTVSGAAALYAIATGEATLRNLERSGLLETLLPELTVCRFLMPRDSTHRYTVFEHTMRVVRKLEEATTDPFLAEVLDSLNDVEALYLGALLHDVGKIDPSQSHSEYGARIAEEVCGRWDVAPRIRASVVWLVAEHLSMARFIRIRDLQNPHTLREFAQVVGDPERLRLLTLLTWADVSAVSEEAWTPAQDTFLRDLYRRTLELLEGEEMPIPDEAVYRRRVMRHLKQEDVPNQEIEEFVESLPAHYLAATPPELVRLHLHFAQRARNGEITVELHHNPDLSATEVTVVAPDAPKLLSRILGVLYALDLGILGLRAGTTQTQPQVALDVFTISFRGRPVPPATGAQIASTIKAVLREERTIEEVLQGKGKDALRPQDFFQYTFHPGTPGVLEVRAPRGKGMAYRFSRLISEQGWNILSARVGQWAGHGAAAFYIWGADGSALTTEEVDAALARRATGV
jgi:[protein-PII] uridylyltransferase